MFFVLWLMLGLNSLRQLQLPYRRSLELGSINPEEIEERLKLDWGSFKKANCTSTSTSTSASASSSLLGQLDRLSFGYEEPQQKQQYMIRRRFTNLDSGIKIKSMGKHVAAVAVCDATRTSGCEPLFADFENDTALTDLPCVTDGFCPFIKFKCSRGHEWKASPGSPVCMHCPICDSKRISGRKRDIQLSRSKLSSELKLYIDSKGGELLTKIKLAEMLSHNTYVNVKCKHHHEWTSSVGNLLLLNTWCSHCHADKMRLSSEELHKTAHHFNGTFLGVKERFIVHPMSEKIEGKAKAKTKIKAVDKNGGDGKVKKRTFVYSWKCSRGHIFRMHPNNIRRKESGKRKCSWCPQCRRQHGLEYSWSP